MNNKTKAKKILITGLCLSRNKGGPAMALSFMDQIKRHLEADFIFAVDSSYLDLEKEWAKRYGVKVVPRDTILEWIIGYFPPVQLVWLLKRFLRGKTIDIQFLHSMRKQCQFFRAVHREYQKAFKEADCVINLNGIAFVGDLEVPWYVSLADLTSSIYAKKHRKPFFRFIQSYGPFKKWQVKLMAKKEFSGLPCVMARGKLSAGYCREVAGKIPVYAFPDVAISLKPANKIWRDDYLKQFNLKAGDYIVLSPSAVMVSLSDKNNSSVGKKHISVFAEIAKYYLYLGKPILFVPHMTSPTLSQCDREVCKMVIEELVKRKIDPSSCYIVADQLDCRELKALIGGAKLAIVSRYHALVASLSSGVPTVTIGWNDKYQDLLDFYDSAYFAVDARMGEPFLVVKEVLKRANAWTNERINLIQKRQAELTKTVDEAGKVCVDWIIKVT